jgi:hypothetical protein
MSSYVLQFQKSDTLAATLLSGATSTTLTSGNFGSPSGTQLYVVDYDVPAKAEIISASVTTTAVTSITRGLTGGAASTTDHAIGAKIISAFVPQHHTGLRDGTDWAATAINQGLVSTSGSQNLTGSQVDVTGLTKTFTVPSGGRAVRLTFMGELQNNTDTLSDARIYLIEDGSTIFSTICPIIRAGVDLSTVVTFQKTPTAGSHTYKVAASYTGGAGTPLIGSGALFYVDLV